MPARGALAVFLVMPGILPFRLVGTVRGCPRSGERAGFGRTVRKLSSRLGRTVRAVSAECQWWVERRMPKRYRTRRKPRSRRTGSGACVVSVRSPGYGFAGSSAPFAAGIGSVAR
ncbi:hypothetical protein GCM10010519_19690 [Streptomyces lactacystinicus]